MLRRLYSTFARGWPGAGLLLMRLVAGSALLRRASSTKWSAAPLDATVTSAFVGVSGILLISGLWTPIAGTLVALVAFAQMLARVEDPGVLVFLGTIGGALVVPDGSVESPRVSHQARRQHHACVRHRPLCRRCPTNPWPRLVRRRPARQLGYLGAAPRLL